jgi:hypothetical protein
MLSLPEKPEFDHPSSILYFKVPDIRQAFQAMRSAARPSKQSRTWWRSWRPTISGSLFSKTRTEISRRS